MSYKQSVTDQLWEYAKSKGTEFAYYLDGGGQPGGDRPPVFNKKYPYLNLIVPSSVDNLESHRKVLLGNIKKHLWLTSMKSSQALAISVFGNLKSQDQIGILNSVLNKAGESPFAGIDDGVRQLTLEYEVDKAVLNESDHAPTSVDAFITGKPSFYIECKFTETEIGTCSMPISKTDKKTKKKNPAQCDGNYNKSNGSVHRCPLTEKGILYWELIPKYFQLENDADLGPCPIRHNYQLVRNCLAAGETGGRVVLVYDDRNPSFQDGGKGMRAFQSCKELLREPSILQSASWQQINVALKNCEETRWLAEALTQKYRF